MSYYDTCAIPKGERQRRQGKARKRKAQWLRGQTTRDYVFERERQHCRVCLRRKANTMHELIFRSAGGKICITNSIAVCGDGTRGCHGALQRNEIEWSGGEEGAEGTLFFEALTPPAAVQVGAPVGRVVTSRARALPELESA